MALKLDYTDNNTGIALIDSYVRIDDIVRGNKTRIVFNVEVFKNKAARQDSKKALVKLTYTLTPHDGLGNLWTQMYDYLKEQPEFADSEDDI